MPRITFFLCLDFVNSLVIALLRGLVLQPLWAWFVVPALGAPELPLASAIGVFVIVSLLTYRFTPTDEDNDLDKMTVEVLTKAFLSKFFGNLLHCASILAMAAIVHAAG